jgi:hypothetical protein
VSEPPGAYLDAFARVVDELTPGDIPAEVWLPALEAMAEARAVVQAREDYRREVFERHYRAWPPVITQVMQLARDMLEEGPPA